MKVIIGSRSQNWNCPNWSSLCYNWGQGKTRSRSWSLHQGQNLKTGSMSYFVYFVTICRNHVKVTKISKLRIISFAFYLKYQKVPHNTYVKFEYQGQQAKVILIILLRNVKVKHMNKAKTEMVIIMWRLRSLKEKVTFLVLFFFKFCSNL